MYSNLSLKDRKELFKEWLIEVSKNDINEIKTNEDFDKYISILKVLLNSYKKVKE